MRRDVQSRLDALEAQRNTAQVPQGLGHFYDLPNAQREALIAQMYGGEQHISSEEAERVYREIMQ
ncbi:hypothetical protein OCT51_11150 [Halomonas sp. LR3S48]|uniref:hypothetical protein n=1 Tax=Halomonas sp. LR3S48 TaxID=2982694 RepID=UPI0021E3920D|nr:hypothetical protein [Halomonas sp. LR3S48]UYG01770.1 hypothetical protein OCT51_11150 [Halomonas sp. LR3S48]